MAAREEIVHYTREQIAGHVVTAIAIADELVLSPEDRATLLPEIVRLLSAKNITVTKAMPMQPFDLGGFARERER